MLYLFRGKTATPRNHWNDDSNDRNGRAKASSNCVRSIWSCHVRIQRKAGRVWPDLEVMMLSFKLSFKRMDILVREYDGVEVDYFMISALEDESHACHPHKLVWSLRTGYGFGQIGLLSTGAGQHPVFHLHFQLLGPVTFTLANFHQVHQVHRFTRIKKASKICVKAGQSWDFVRKTAWCEASDFLTENSRRTFPM